MPRSTKELGAYEAAAKRDLTTAAEFIDATSVSVAAFHQDNNSYRGVNPKAIRKEMITLRKSIRYLNNIIKGIEE